MKHHVSCENIVVENVHLDLQEEAGESDEEHLRYIRCISEAAWPLDGINI